MRPARSFKSDESFVEKIVIGATGTRRVFENLAAQEHAPIELERGSMSFKIWKAVKIKRIRVPDILCLRCGRRVECRTKTKMEITLSHSAATQERGWDFGLDDDDRIALVHCERTGFGTLDWSASELVQYVRVKPLRETWRDRRVRVERPKGMQEGFETRVTWPAIVARADGVIDEVSADRIRYRRLDGRAVTHRLDRSTGGLMPCVRQGDRIKAHQIIASIVPVAESWECAGGAEIEAYLALAAGTALTDRYASIKALGCFDNRAARAALVDRVQDPKEHVYVQLEAAKGLMRAGDPLGRRFLEAALRHEYLENRLEAAIVLGELATAEAAELLITTLGDPHQHPEIRAGAAWALGEIGSDRALPALVNSFTSLEAAIKVEAARALAKISRNHLDATIGAFRDSEPEQRPGIAWALSKARDLRVSRLLPTAADEDARHWLAYIIGSQDRSAILPEIETLSAYDPEVYFAVTVLWKIMTSWVYRLEEH